LKEVAELGIDSGWKGFFKALNLFGDVAEKGGVLLGVAPALFVSNDGEAFPEGGGEGGQGFVHRKTA